MKRTGDKSLKAYLRGYYSLLITVILFSTYEAVSKTLVDKINPFQINFIRFFVGGVLLLVFLCIKKDLYISKKEIFPVVLLGIINVVISMNLLQMSLYMKDARASVVAVIFSSNPIFVTFFAAFMEKEKITLSKILGLSIGVTGLITIFIEKLGSGISDYKSPLYALLSAAFYGIYTVLGKKVSLRIGSMKMNSYSFIAGSLVLLPVLMVMKVPVFSFDYSGICQVAYLSFFVTGLAYLLYFKGLSIVGSSKGSLVFFIKPALASFIAILFLKEAASFNLFLGTLMIIAGIVVIVYGSEFIGKIQGK